MRRGAQDYRPENLQRIRKLRKEMSISEKALWARIRHERLGFSFRRQVPVDDYVLDFYCAKARVAVEVDGEQHLERLDQDQRRDHSLGHQGILTIRIPSLDLFEADGKKLDEWLRLIAQTCASRSG